MVRCCLMLTIVTILSAPASAEHRYLWRQVAEVEEVSIQIHPLDTAAEMRSLQTKYGHSSTTKQGLLAAFAVLKRIDGAYHCTIYTYGDVAPDELAHEQRHCHGWAHY